MKRLNNQDLQILISAIADLNADFEPTTLPERALKAATKVIEADSVAFTGINYDGTLSGLAWDSSEAISPEEIEIFARFIHEQPLIKPFLIERRTETLKITDLMPAEKFERTNIYNEFYKRVGVRNQLVSPLSVSPDLFVSCSANTSKQDFSDRSKTMSILLAPHLVSAIRNAFAYERLNASLATQNCGVIAVDSNGKPQFVSEFARRLLENYFSEEKRVVGDLPETIANWMRRTSGKREQKTFELPPAPLKIKNAVGELTVRLIFSETTREETLLLEERPSLSPKMFEQLNLTPRQSEILFWIAQGKSDDAIAALCRISPRTVHKHAENIYAKLGVETRTSAMLKALELL